ncbi:hypothetical protein B566_EDAN007348 [Ephemera danica]|nr:hypothetical protein B566_EDAN007348 [Ephemera danica]
MFLFCNRRNMKCTEKELAQFGSQAPADFEGRLHYRPPGGNFSQSGFKERWFKLSANFLFYYRINDMGVVDRKEPSGVFILEHSLVQAEDTPGTPFAFSITFQDDLPDRKHIFAARSEDQVQQWVTAIQSCSYEYWRGILRSLQGKIKKLTGKATTFKSHLPMTENHSTSWNSGLASEATNSTGSASPSLRIKADIPVTLPAPPRPTRSGNRKTQSAVLQAVRDAPPPPTNAPPPRQSCPTPKYRWAKKFSKTIKAT